MALLRAQLQTSHINTFSEWQMSMLMLCLLSYWLQ